jgi:drug/metabolite transporter (DMT)-like permease
VSADAPDAAESRESGPLGVVLLFVCVAIWGINTVAFKIATKPSVGVGFDAIFLTGIRFLIAAPCLALLALWRQPGALRLTKPEIRVYALFGLFSVGFGEVLQTLAVRYTSVANLTLLSHGTISLCTALWASALYGQRLGKFGLAGALLALIGVALVATHAPGGLRFGGETWRGDALALTRSVVHGGYLLMLGRWLRHHSALQATVYNCAFGALWCLPYVLYRAPGFVWTAVAPQVWWALAWTVVPTTLFGFVAWNWAMGRVGPVAATNVFYLLPLAASIAAWKLIGEPITIWHALGGAVIIAGIAVLRRGALLESK